jgi:DNA-binding NarL/FixJ family response regulator
MSNTRCVMLAVAVLMAALTGTLRAAQDNVSPVPGAFGLTGLGLMCAVCLSFRRHSPPTNGPAPRISLADYQGREALHSVEASIRQMKRAFPDAVLLEIGFHGMSANDGIRMLKSVCPEAEFLVMAVYDDRGVFEAMCTGACGNLIQETPAPIAWEALREVQAGRAPNSPKAPRRVIALIRKMRPPETPEYTLTTQETRVLRLLGEGHHYKTAAADLGVTLNTLSFHVRRIYGKLQVHSKAEAVAKALRDGILY